MASTPPQQLRPELNTHERRPRQEDLRQARLCVVEGLDVGDRYLPFLEPDLQVQALFNRTARRRRLGREGAA
jgi:hypothetical protein